MSESSHENARLNYESAAQHFAPFPDAALIEVAQLSTNPDDPKVGIYRARNGEPNGEDVIVMLPNDFPDEPETVGVDINDFDPRRKESTTPVRDVLYNLFELEPGDSAIEQYKTGFTDMGRAIADKLPQMFRGDPEAKPVNPEYTAPSKIRKAAAVLALSAGVVGTIATSGGSNKAALNQEQLNQANEHVAQPEAVKISYTVPKSSPRVLDLATALDMKPEAVAEQIEKQVGGRLASTDKLPADVVLEVTARGTDYSPKPTDTISSLSSRFNVPPNVLIAANVDTLSNIPADQALSLTSSVTIPRPVTIVSLPEGSTVEDASKVPQIADITNENPSLLTAVDPGFDGNSVVIPEDFDTSTLADIATTTVPAPEAPATTTPEVPATPVIPEVARLNESLQPIDINAPVNDIAGVVPAVQALDAWFAPNDPHRRADLPAGYVKMLLPNEAEGVMPLRTVALKTAELEMYTSAYTEATARSIAVGFDHFITTKYPQYAGAVTRLRDANSPNHRTHQYGQMLDFSTSMGMGVTQYSDGPIADTQFSPNNNQAFDIDMLLFMAGLRFGDQNAIRSVVSSDKAVINAVNGQLGRKFMSYDDDGEHQDHWHIIMNDDFNLPTFGLRARDLAWGPNEDLWIGDRALPITPEQERAEHGPLQDWFAEQLRIVAEKQAAEAAAAAEAAKTPEQRLAEAQMVLLDEIAKHEGNVDSINTGKAGDTPVDSDRYKQILEGRRLSDYTIHDLQTDLREKGVRAAGSNQIMPDTLDASVEATGIDTNRKFDASAQRELGIYLLMSNRKALREYFTGEADSVEKAVDALCKEFSSLPCMDGTGNYDGDAAGNNAAGGKERVKLVISMLQAIRDANLKVINKQ